MSHIPIGSQSLDRDFLGTAVRGRYANGLVPQGISAELIGGGVYGGVLLALHRATCTSNCRSVR